MLDPASGTLVIRPEADTVIQETLRREARRLAFYFRLRQPIIEVRYFVLKLRYAALRLIGLCTRNLPKFIFHSRHRFRSLVRGNARIAERRAGR
jgi:hypothetical protein